jgi:hypothetical protein
MLAFIAALVLPAQAVTPVSVGQTAWVFSTIGQSEWCPAGNVMLDLRTGRYALTSRADRQVCNDPALERPVKRGVLTGKQLASARAAYLRAFSEGLDKSTCRDGHPLRPDELVISNGGVRILVVASGSRTLPAPEELTCWSEAASALKDLLDHIFSPGDYPRKH